MDDYGLRSNYVWNPLVSFIYYISTSAKVCPAHRKQTTFAQHTNIAKKKSLLNVLFIILNQNNSKLL